jgi:hypothetical protein
VSALRRLAARLEARAVELVLVSYPNHESYVVRRPPAWDVAIEQALSAVRAELGRDVPHWDLRRSALFADADFGNPDHLNARGARKLASLLDEHLAAAGRAERIQLSSR